MPDTRVRRAHRRSRRRSRAVCSSHVPRAPASSIRRATTRWPQGRAALLPAPRCTPRQLPSRILRAVAAPHVACLTLTSESPRIAPPPPLSHRRHHSAAASAYPLACPTLLSLALARAACAQPRPVRARPTDTYDLSLVVSGRPVAVALHAARPRCARRYAVRCAPLTCRRSCAAAPATSGSFPSANP